MHWRIKLTDDNGTFWLTDRARMWSDDPDDALKFLCERTADEARKLAIARCHGIAHWNPKIRMIKFVEIKG